MRNRLFSLPLVKPGEKYLVSIILVQALFLGFFFGAFDICAHSLFLSVFDEKILARGYLVSGLAGMIVLLVFYRYPSVMNFRSFAVINLVSIAAITLILWISYIITPADWVIFTVFILSGPLNILAILGFRSTTGTLFPPENGRNLAPVFDKALIAGVILICYSIAILIHFNFTLPHLLLVSTLSLSVAAILQAMAADGFQALKGDNPVQTKPSENKPAVTDSFRNDRYLKILAIFMILSVASAFFIRYSFLAVTREEFSSGERIAVFLGIFTGSAMIMALLADRILFPGMLQKYGLRRVLVISPFIIAVLTLLAAASGTIFGYTPGKAAGFMIFFILLAAARLFSSSPDLIRESPFLKLLLKPAKEKMEHGSLTITEGVVKQFALLLTGIVLTGLGSLFFIRLIHFSWILLVVELGWLTAAFLLYTEYRNSVLRGIRTSVAPEIDGVESDKKIVFNSRYYGERVFRADYFNLISGDFAIFEKTKNRFYFKKILDHTVSKRDTNLFPLIKKIAGEGYDEVISREAAGLVNNMEELSSRWKKEDQRIISAQKILSETRMPQTTEILRLLRDKSLESKRLAIYMIGKFRLTDMLPEVCQCLNVPGLETDTSSVLTAFGSSAEKELMQFYLVSSGNTYTSKTILRLLARLASDESTGFLFSRLWSNSRQLREEAVKCLIDLNFRPTAEEKYRLHQIITETGAVITWNISAKRCLEQSGDNLLAEEMKKELVRWKKYLINILLIAYEADIIARIRENFENQTIESINFALEILDIIGDDQLKAIIISVFDCIPDTEKLKNLNQFYPSEIRQADKLAEDLINRDYNLLSLWTKACVLKYLPGIADDELSESVVALLFSPENILQEEAVRMIARIDPELYRSVSHRIPVQVRMHLERIINEEAEPWELLSEKILFLSGCFKGIIEEELLFLARSLIFVKDLGAIKLTYSDGYLIWSLPGTNGMPRAGVYYSASVDNQGDRVSKDETGSYYILSLSAVEVFLYHFPGNERVVLEYVDKNEN
jgi:hypothetical protein